MTKRRDIDPINLLLIEEDFEKGEEISNSEVKYHFAWIKNLNRLLARTRKDGENKYTTKVFCPYCCYGFRKKNNGERNFAKNKFSCRPNDPQRTAYLPKSEKM